MIESGLNLDAFPAGFSLLNVYPAEILDNLLILVYTSQDEKVFTKHARCMVFTGFSEVS